LLPNPNPVSLPANNHTLTERSMRFLASFLAVLAVLGNLSLSAMSCQMMPESLLGIEALSVVCSVSLDGDHGPSPVDSAESKDCCTTCFHLGSQPLGPSAPVGLSNAAPLVSRTPVLASPSDHLAQGFVFSFPNKGSPAAL